MKKIISLLFFLSFQLFASSVLTIYKNGYYTSQSTVELPKISNTNYFSIMIPENVHLNSIILFPYDDSIQIFSYDIQSHSESQTYKKKFSLLSKLTNKTIEIIDSNNETFKGILLKLFRNYFYVKNDLNHYFLIDRRFIKAIKSSAFALTNSASVLNKSQKELKILYSAKQNSKIGIFYTASGLSCVPQYKTKLNLKKKTLFFEQGFIIQNTTKFGFTNVLLRYADDNLTVNTPRPLYRKNANLSKMKALGVESTPIAINSDYNMQISKTKILSSDEYTIKHNATIEPMSYKMMRYFSIFNIPYKQSYIALYNTVKTKISFTNNKKNTLGFTLTGGVIKIFTQSSNIFHLIGDANLPRTLNNEEVAFYPEIDKDIKIKRKTKNREQISKTVQRITIEILINNSKSTNINLEVSEHLYGNWKIKKSSNKYKKKNFNTIIFNVSIPAHTKKIISYTYTLKQKK